MNIKITITSSISFIILLATAAIAQKETPQKNDTKAEVKTNFPQTEEYNQQLLSRLVLPAGFKITPVATGLGKPRMLAVNADGGLYVTRRDQGDILLLKDNDGDTKFDDLKTVMTQFKGVHGICLRDGFLYACSNKELKRAKIKPNGELESATTLISDLPDGGQHGNRTIAFGPDGKLYITVGSSCNDCNETNKEHATILQADAEGKNRVIFARGLRNTIGIDWNDKNEMWGADNGTDWRGDDIPPEEINKITEGSHYGWPFIYGNREVDYTREDPAGTTKEAFAQTTQPMQLSLPAHSAPINFVFIKNNNKFPQEYVDDAIVSLHGSWNRSAPQGYQLKRIHFENGKAVSSTDFLTGFLNKDGTSRFGRPGGLALSNNGLYVSDDANGIIYLISHTK